MCVLNRNGTVSYILLVVVTVTTESEKPVLIEPNLLRVRRRKHIRIRIRGVILEVEAGILLGLSRVSWVEWILSVMWNWCVWFRILFLTKKWVLEDGWKRLGRGGKILGVEDREERCKMEDGREGLFFCRVWFIGLPFSLQLEKKKKKKKNPSKLFTLIFICVFSRIYMGC